MTSAQLNSETVHRCAVAADPANINSGSGRLAWQLGHGQAVSKQTVEKLGLTKHTLSATVHALKQAGWGIEAKADGRRVSEYRAVRRPDGTPVKANGQKAHNGIRKPRKTEPLHFGESAAAQLDRRNGQKPATHPDLGAQLRVGMLADQNGTVVMALHDDHGQIWWARLDAAPM